MTMNYTATELRVMRKAINRMMANYEDCGWEETDGYKTMIKLYDELVSITSPKYTVKRLLNDPEESYLILSETLETDVAEVSARETYDVIKVDTTKNIIWVA